MCPYADAVCAHKQSVPFTGGDRDADRLESGRGAAFDDRSHS
jgi:hypothetical protein